MSVALSIIIGWIAIGALVGVIEARHGAWRRGWVVAAVFGPLAIPLAVARRRMISIAPVVVGESSPGPGEVDVLVGIDGSEASLAASELAAALFGPRLRRVTLAAVLDVDTAEPHAGSVLNPEPWDEEEEARVNIATAAESLRAATGIETGAVVLAGDPATALERYAVDEHYDVVVAGCSGRGLTKLLLGSCASRLARAKEVPVLLVPTGTAATSTRPSAVGT